ncbi:MAG: hypothetical protein HY554_17570 [Elusimicrobia bacterium]|nr:hypothetical protein [Elusimicrobiota bacterium]
MEASMGQEAALEAHLKRIREIMELASEFKLLPDRAAIAGGIAVLAATALTWGLTRSGDVRQVLWLPPERQLFVAGLWVTVAAGSILLHYALTLREAYRLGVSLQGRPAQLVRLNMGLPILAASIVTLGLLKHGYLGFIPGLWMLLYGIGLYSAGQLSSAPPRVLGLAFMATGAASILVVPDMDLWLTALSFGGYHIAFGGYVLANRKA